MRTALLTVFVFGGMAVGADDDLKAAIEKVKDTVKKAKAASEEASKDEEKETARILKAIKEDEPPEVFERVELMMKRDRLGIIRTGTQTIGNYLWSKGLGKWLIRQSIPTLDDAEFIELVARCNPEIKPRDLAIVALEWTTAETVAKSVVVKAKRAGKPVPAEEREATHLLKLIRGR